jgi:NADH:ubiquinone oxidoreductase subunit 4 (subunit M)
VISTVFMLRAYRKTFMGTISDQWKHLADLRPTLRVPVTLLVGALLCYGFFPQSFVRVVAPKFRTYLTANNYLTGTQNCSHGAVRRPRILTQHEEDAPQGRGYNLQ